MSRDEFDELLIGKGKREPRYVRRIESSRRWCEHLMGCRGNVYQMPLLISRYVEEGRVDRSIRSVRPIRPVRPVRSSNPFAKNKAGPAYSISNNSWKTTLRR